MRRRSAHPRARAANPATAWPFRAAALAFLAGVALAIATPAGGSERSGGLLPVPAQDIARGERITGDKLTEKHFYYDPSRPVAAVTDPARVIGKEARRHLRAGRPIPKNAFKASVLVKRGQPAIARFTRGNLTIDAAVLPQDSGGEGEMVRARNIDTGRIITGVVGSDGTIAVNTL